MAQAARFRNVLSHTYGQIINHDIVYNALQDLNRYRLFVQQISEYLDALDVFEDD